MAVLVLANTNIPELGKFERLSVFFMNKQNWNRLEGIEVETRGLCKLEESSLRLFEIELGSSSSRRWKYAGISYPRNIPWIQSSSSSKERSYKNMSYSSSWLGTTIKRNMMEGRPTRTKSEGDYSGSAIPPCGDYVTREGKVTRPPWLPAVVKGKSISWVFCLSMITLMWPSVGRLDEEIRTFMQYMEPTSQEVRMRKDLVQRFTKLITSFNMNASIRPVGSYVTGL